jgi:hypothetical protein
MNFSCSHPQQFLIVRSENDLKKEKKIKKQAIAKYRFHKKLEKVEGLPDENVEV